MHLDQISNTNSQILINSAKKLGIKVELLDEEKLKLRLTLNNKSHIVTKKSFGINPSQAIKLTRNKNRVSQLLAKHHIPLPQEVQINSISELESKKLPPLPLVIKPSEGQKGHDVYIGIKDSKTLLKTAKLALSKVNPIIIQEYIQGFDTRFFVLDGKVIGAVNRHPPQLTGNGQHNIEKLIKLHNQRLLTRRAKTGRRLQNRILNWPRVNWHLTNQRLSLKTILPKGKTIEPYPVANFQAGGTVATIPVNKIHPSFTALTEKVATLTGLVVCGIDMIIKNHKKPSKNNVWFLEINSDPSLRLHEWPNQGKPQSVTEKLLKYIFREP